KHLVCNGAEVGLGGSSVWYEADRVRDSGAEEWVARELIGELPVSLGERMAGVAILWAGQRRRHRVGDTPRAEPVPNRGLDLLISPQALGAEQVLVEGADQDEDAVPSLQEKIDHAPECLPLQGRGQVDPRIVLPGDAALVPGMRQVPAVLV